MRGNLTQALNNYLTHLNNTGLLRQLQLAEVSPRNNFSSNDYLSLRTDPRVQAAYQTGYARYPTGSGSSMVVCGYHPMHQHLERTFAEALQVDACLIFSSGYAANLSIVSLLAEVNAHLIIDKAIHASIYDGIRLNGACYHRYQHNDLSDLAKILNVTTTSSVVLTESIFSMSGQQTALSDIVGLARQFNSDVLVDEAHAFGVVGPEGLGGVAAAGLTQDQIPLRIIPFGKSCAGSGAIVAGQGVWIEALLQAARPHIYSTAISPACAYGLSETLTILRESDARRTHLAQLVAYFRTKISQSPVKWRDSHTPIQQLFIGCPHRALAIGKTLRTKGIICLPMRQPTVAKNETGLRIMLNYHHQPEDIDKVLDLIFEEVEMIA